MNYDYILRNANINSQKAIERMGGLEKIYYKFLLRFPTEPTYALSVKAYHENDYEELLLQIHTLKGVCLNLELNDLFEVVTKILADLRLKDYSNLPSYMYELEDAYTKTCNTIKMLEMSIEV